MGDEITAETYVAQPDWIEEGLPLGQDYVNHVVNGAKESGLPDDYIQNIVQWELWNQGQY
ncbi:MAG: gamma-glutamylcyclotransferase [Hormoscilla sp. GUM202]|nr:gamma-glutamylcyclotransferase [Hormoscilla sp. GUM202]